MFLTQTFAHIYLIRAACLAHTIILKLIVVTVFGTNTMNLLNTLLSPESSDFVILGSKYPTQRSVPKHIDVILFL
jgi:hypothetical protein